MQHAYQPCHCITVTFSFSARQSYNNYESTRHFGDSASQGLASAMFWLMFLVDIATQTQDGSAPKANVSIVLHIWTSLCRRVACKLHISLHIPAMTQKKT